MEYCFLKLQIKKTAEQNLIQFTHSKEFLSRYKALVGIKEDLNNPASVKLLSAALKDPFFRIRIKALELLDLTDAKQNKYLIADVEKIAAEDSKTLVQAAAISALSKTKNKKYLPLFEKGIDAVSHSVKANSFLAIMATDPSKAKALANKIDLSQASRDMVVKMFPIVIENKIDSQMQYTVSIVALYPLVKLRNPVLGKFAEEGFNRIMESDDLAATKGIANVLNQEKNELTKDAEIKKEIYTALEAGLNKKNELLNNKPQNQGNISKQIAVLKQIMTKYK